jgi:hypothetical protein
VRRGLVLAITVLLFVAWTRAGNARAGHIDLLLALLVLVSLPPAQWMNERSFKKAYGRGVFQRANKECTLEISEEAIQSADSTNREEWSHFSKYSESKNAFIPYTADSIYAIFPKRTFDTNGMDTFRRLIAAKLARF